jgi:hypothetical protein
MSEINDGGPAFPETCDEYDNEVSKYRIRSYGGMTLRDYFAAKALPAVIEEYCRGNGTCIGTDHILGNASIIAYKLADAMLKARTE